MCETYLEVSFSIAFSDSYSKNLVKEVAKQLRDAYLRDKEWTLMRNLEEIEIYLVDHQRSFCFIILRRYDYNCSLR